MKRLGIYIFIYVESLDQQAGKRFMNLIGPSIKVFMEEYKITEDPTVFIEDDKGEVRIADSHIQSTSRSNQEG